MRKRAPVFYDRAHGLPGHIVLRGRSEDQGSANRTTIELVILSKFIWGRGASVNSVFNTGSAMVKFQGPPDDNFRRAKLLAKAWRVSVALGVEISRLPAFNNNNRPVGMEFTEDWPTISQRLSAYVPTGDRTLPFTSKA